MPRENYTNLSLANNMVYNNILNLLRKKTRFPSLLPTVFYFRQGVTLRIKSDIKVNHKSDILH